MPYPLRQAGMAALEFALIALPLLVASLAVLEVGRWQLTRVTLGHALLEAARSGQDGWQDPQAVATRFQAAVLPLWGADATPARQAQANQRRQQAEQHFQQHHGRPMWQIQPASPHYPADAPPSLVVELLWWHRPWVPGMQALLKQLGRVPPVSEQRAGMAQTGWLPIRLRLALEWQLLPTESPPDHAALARLGPAGPIAPASALPESGGLPLWPGASAGTGSLFVPPRQASGSSPPPALEPDLCGTVLCCNG